ncbi:hypothetical protein E5K00_03615 [Hymenobacter aquaticus]|uniref:Uncharacterized protein n=1 Tax=Hymenobacter aquaticus TaxID=1867101 RepID=A0A4Z0Q3Z4_9BACT|nr:hypothetical protein [Hymenobacter aquaticus]TGE24314.1 hypothetical protein E5K00_03615 [Hymenobacter aquaticus]
MQPEDIDKLFRDQLQHHAPTPPAYLWNQLEEEIRPAKKRPAMWLYAAAAMIALLIVAGGGWLLRPSGTEPAAGTLASTTGSAPQSNPVTGEEKSAAKKSAGPQATADPAFPSSRLEDPTNPSAVAAAPVPTPASAEQATSARTSQPASRPAATVNRLVAQAAAKPTPATGPAPVPAQAVAQVASAAVSVQPEHRSAPEVAATPTPTPVSPAPTGAIEVEVHRGTEAPVVVAAADAQPRYESDSHLKNLFHKAKTAVKDGRVKLPKVELPETVTVQVNVFNHSATKVIQL